MNRGQADFQTAVGDDARKDPVRLLLVQADERPAVHATDEPMVMTFPHLLVRELIALLALSTALVVVSILFDAPLEEIANPEKTPNPAKAPWYFLGLQELLHYYPPLISGVVLPGLVVLALAVIPYFDINLSRPPLFEHARTRRLGMLWAAVAALTLVFLFTGAHPVWPLIVPLWVVALVASLPVVASGSFWVARWIYPCSLAFWVFLWFLLASVMLTAIGVFFRGPGWALTMPWRDGVY